MFSLESLVPRTDCAPPLPRQGEEIVQRPRSASGVWTGMAGVAGGITAMVLLRGWLEPSWLKATAVLALSAGAMLLVDGLAYRTGGRPTTGLAHQALRPLDFRRLALKLAGFWLTIGILAAAYTVLPPYAAAFFAPSRAVALWCLPMLAVVSPFYIAYVDRRLREPNDAYAQLGALLVGRRPDDWGSLTLHARGWAVKGFFLPLMFVYVANGLDALWGQPLFPDWANFQQVYERLFDFMFLVDVLLAAVAYTLTLRVFDTQMRSVEPTAGGWIVCLACYPPFNGLTGQYFPFDQDQLYWGKVFAPVPLVYAVWGGAILVLVLIYAMSTAAFGLRFSNLTNRGIITSGPYRWSKHPAYISKNISWWLISVPFIAGAGWLQAVQSCLLLGGVNLVYFLRARTEERHLSLDPTYRDYCEFIARDGLWARLKRLAARPKAQFSPEA